MSKHEFSEKKAFLTALVEEPSERFQLLKARKSRALRLALDYVGIEGRPLNQQKLASREGIAAPRVSHEIALALCFLGYESDWSDTVLQDIERFECQVMGIQRRKESKKDRSHHRKLRESERMRVEMGWSAMPPNLNDEEKQLCLQLIEMYEDGHLEYLRDQWPEEYLVLYYRYGLDFAGRYRTYPEVESLLEMSVSAIQSRCKKVIRIIQSKKFQRMIKASVDGENHQNSLMHMYQSMGLSLLREFPHGEEMYDVVCMRHGLRTNNKRRSLVEVSELLSMSLSRAGDRYRDAMRIMKTNAFKEKVRRMNE